MPLFQVDPVVTIAVIRDIAIIVLIVLLFLFMLFMGLLGFMLYRKITPILESVRVVAKNAQESSTLVTEYIVRPLTIGPGLIGGARQVIESVGRFFSKGGRDEDGDGKEQRR